MRLYQNPEAASFIRIGDGEQTLIHNSQSFQKPFETSSYIISKYLIILQPYEKTRRQLFAQRIKKENDRNPEISGY